MRNCKYVQSVALAGKGARYVREFGKDEMIKRINDKDPMFRQGAGIYRR